MKFGLNMGLFGGSKGITAPIAAGDYIWYSYEQFAGWGINESGQNVAIDGDTISPNFDGLVRASNVILPNAEGVNYPIIHDLGADSKKLAASVEAGWVDNGDNTYTGTNATGWILNVSAIDNTGTNILGEVEILDITSGGVRNISNGMDNDTPLNTAVGTYTNNILATSHTMYLRGEDFTGTVRINSVREVTLPANSYLYYLDHATQTLKALSSTGDVGEVLPISTTYNLVDSHQLVWNCTKALTANEVAQVEADPTLMMYVYFDGLVLVDGFSKADIGNFFDANGNDKYIQDLSVDLGVNEVTSFSVMENADETANLVNSSNDSFRVNITVAGTNANRPKFTFNKSASNNNLSLITFEAVSHSGVFFSGQIYGHPSAILVDLGLEVVSSGRYAFYANLPSTDTGIVFYIHGTNVGDTEFKDITYRELTGYTEILGTYTEANRLHNQLQGVNTLRTIGDGRTTDVVANNLARFNGTGQSIDTGVAIDGSLTDFTMMMAFTLPETLDSIFIANTDGTNRLYLWHDPSNPINVITAQIGQFVQEMTFNEAITNHAMCAVYDHTTSMLQVAIDGDPLSVAFPIVFDGITGIVIFGARDTAGANTFTGYLGEGILVADKLEEADWQDFWDGVKLGVTFDGGLFSNGGFENSIEDWIVTGGWHATIDAETTTNDGGVNDMMFQNFTLEDGVTYEISADRLSGDAVVTFILYDADSGVDITAGTHQFLGDGVARSIGVVINTAGTVDTVCDNLRLVKIADAVLEAVTFDGELVTFEGKQVTFKG